MSKHKCDVTSKLLPSRVVGVLGLTLLLLLIGSSVGYAQEVPSLAGQVRAIEPAELGITNPAGLAFSPAAGDFYVVEARDLGGGRAWFSDITVVSASPLDHQVGMVRVMTAVSDPINMTFDGKASRLLLYQPASLELVDITAGPDGELSPMMLTRHSVPHFGLRNPQGMAVDPASGRLFLLDSIGPRLVRIEPDPDGGFDSAAITRLDLVDTDLQSLRGLALNPTNGHLYTLNPAQKRLYELTQTGRIVASHDISSMVLGDPQGLAFAPSGDLTDDPSLTSLYIADAGLADGQIVELAFDEMEPLADAAPTVYASLVQTIDTSAFNPPSPDSAGIVYIESFGALLMSDSEVNEMPPYFTGDNIFEFTTGGGLLGTASTLPEVTEPSGLAYDPADHLLFIGDDGKKRIWVIDPGSDGLFFTADDPAKTSFHTELFGSVDPEGVAFDTSSGVLFVADGVNKEVYRIDPGPDGIFNGVDPEGDDIVTHWDMEIHGAIDLEGIGYDEENGYLYLVGKPKNDVYHVTTTGTLVRKVDISAANHTRPAGVTPGPGTPDPRVMNLYVADRGVDNDSDPLENDGKVYELYVPPLTADVTITKSVEPSSVAPGEVIAYTLAFSNEGNSTARDVVITDIIPPELTVLSVVSSGATVVDSGATPPYVWNVQDLTTVDEGVIVVTAQVTSALSCFELITNEATITTSSSDARSGNNSSSVTIAAGAGVSVSPISGFKLGNPGQNVTYDLWVTNEGGCTDTFDVSVSGTAWPVSAPSTVGPLAPGAGQSVQVTVHVPSDAPCGAESAIVTFTSQGAGNLSASSELVTTINAVYDVTVDQPTAALSGLPGTELPYVLHVTNAGNCVDTFAVAASTPNWITSAPTAIGPLAPGVVHSVTVTTIVPLESACTNQDVTTVTFTSSNGTAFASSILTSSALPAYEVLVEPDIATASANPGLDAFYILRVTNTGNCTETFSFSAAGDEWLATALPADVELAPAAFADVDVAVTVPAGAQCGSSDSATVAFTSQSDGTTSDWSILTTSVTTFRSVSVFPQSDTLPGNPGSPVVYTLQASNAGNCPDTIDVSVSGTTWPVIPQYTQLVLAPNEERTIDVTVNVPPDAPCGPEAATVTLTSSDGVTSTAAVLTTTVSAIYGVLVEPEIAAASADPGTNAPYSLRVTNIGNCSDTFAFSAIGDLWPASALPTAVTLAPDAFADVDVSVAVPAGAVCGDNDSALVAFTSQSLGTVSDSSILTTSAGAAPALTVVPSSETGSAMPGLDAIYTLRVTNIGNCSDTFDFSASGDEWTASAVPPTVTLAPNGYADVDVYVTVPAGARCIDSDFATVAFTSRADNLVSESSILTTSALPVYGVTVEPTGDSGWADPGAGAVYPLRVTNVGNCIDTFAFSASGDEWTASAQPTAVQLNRDEYVDVDVTVTVPPGARCGESDIATVTFTSSGSGSISDSSSLTTSANTVYGVTVEPSNDAASGYPNTDVPYTLWVANTGNCSDTFGRSIGDNLWPVSSSPSVVGPLDPDTGASVNVMVTVPACTLGGISDNATLTFISQHHGATTGSAALTTTADHAVPVAGDDQYDVPEDGARVMAAPGVLGNDIDANCEDLTVGTHTQPAHGTLMLAPDGSFAYTPTLNYHGVDTFTYDAYDGALSDTATVTITVTTSGDDPVVDAGADQPAFGEPTIYELDLVSFAGSYVDPAPQALFAEESYHWDFGDGNSETGTLTPDHVYLDNDAYAVTLTVTDANGDVGQDWLTVTVLNAAPEVNAGPDQRPEPGELISFAGVFTDTVADTHTIQWDLDDGTIIDGILAFDHAFDATGDYAVTLTVTDDDGGVGIDTAIISVRLKVYLPMVLR